MIALGTDTDGHDRLAKRKWYRVGYGASVVAAVLALVVASTLGYPLLGIGLYWAGVAVMFGILWLTPIELFDERDQQRERFAALRTLQVVGIAGIVAIPGLVGLEEAGYVTIAPALNGAIWGFVGLFGLFGVVYVILWLRG
jgi:uncharacterized membrane protein